jgi:hypothetical protein
MAYAIAICAAHRFVDDNASRADSVAETAAAAEEKRCGRSSSFEGLGEERGGSGVPVVKKGLLYEKGEIDFESNVACKGRLPLGTTPGIAKGGKAGGIEL